MGSISSAIAGTLLFGILAALSLYNAVRCDKSIREFGKRGKLQKAEIISFRKRREKTSAGIRYTMVTYYDITVKTELSQGRVITRTIRSSSFWARKYSKRSHADVAFIQRDGDTLNAENLKLKEDLMSSPEFFLSIVLFIVFSVFFIMNIVGLFA